MSSIEIAPQESLYFTIGVINEYTETESTSQKIHVTVFSSGQVGSIIKLDDCYHHDRFLFQRNNNINQPDPEKFGGTSGAGVWEIKNLYNDMEELVFNFIGVIFYETPKKEDGSNDFILNGPKSIIKIIF